MLAPLAVSSLALLTIFALSTSLLALDFLGSHIVSNQHMPSVANLPLPVNSGEPVAPEKPKVVKRGARAGEIAEESESACESRTTGFSKNRIAAIFISLRSSLGELGRVCPRADESKTC